MLIIEYNASQGVVVPDANARDYAFSVIKGYRSSLRDDITITVASETLMNAFRVLVSQGAMDHNEFKIKFEGALIDVTKDGRLKKWPPGLCDITSKMLRALARAGSVQRGTGQDDVR